MVDSLVKPWALAGRRLHEATGRYRKIRPDGEGRIAAESLEVWFAIGADGQSIDLFDARSGEKLRDLHAAEEARRVAEEARRAEAEARRVAEEARCAEAEARRAEAEARRVAEEARHAAEDEIRRLRALLAEGKTSD